jgi:hypothetical protein
MKQLLISLLVMAGLGIANQGIFEQTWVPRYAEAFPNFDETNPANGLIDVQVEIDFSDTISKVLPTLFGNNLNGWMKAAILTDVQAHDHMKRANMTYLRLPGGNWSNQWMWDESVPSPVKEDYASTLQSVVRAFTLNGKPLRLTWNPVEQGLYSPSIAQFNGILLIRYKNQSYSVLNIQPQITAN